MSTSERPTVSIITPAFNHERFIGPCIASVLSQDYANWEQIIIDDGSTDTTADVVRSFCDPRIRYFRQNNLGIEALAHTYNRALGLSRGEFVAILEGDDAWPSYKLVSLMRAFQEREIVLAYGAVGDIPENGRWDGRLSRSTKARMRLPRAVLFNTPVRSATNYLMTAEGVDLVPPSTVIIRASTLQSIGGFQYVPGLCVTDFPTVLRLSLEGEFFYTPRVMGYRRRHWGSATLANYDTITSMAETHAREMASRLGYNATDTARIVSTWRRAERTRAFGRGRLALFGGNRSIARTHFLRAINLRNPIISIAALAGLFSCFFRFDFEVLMSWVGAVRVSDTRRGASG